MTILLSVVAWLLTYLMHSTILLGGAFLLATLGVVRSNPARDTLQVEESVVAFSARPP